MSSADLPVSIEDLERAAGRVINYSSEIVSTVLFRTDVCADEMRARIYQCAIGISIDLVKNRGALDPDACSDRIIAELGLQKKKSSAQ